MNLKILNQTLLILIVFFSSLTNAQDWIYPDSSFQRVLILDSMWVAGSKSKTPLRDSVNYLVLKGNSVEFRHVSNDRERNEVGRIYRLRVNRLDESESCSFYIVDRGAFKGSLTVLMKSTGDTAELHITDPWSIYDRYFSAHFSGEDALVRPEKRNRKPKAHDRPVQ